MCSFSSAWSMENHIVRGAEHNPATSGTSSQELPEQQILKQVLSTETPQLIVNELVLFVILSHLQEAPNVDFDAQQWVTGLM